MKRIISCMLAVILSFGGMHAMAADEEYNKEYYKEAAQVVNELGIYGGGEDISQQTTRMEVIKALLNTVTSNADLSNDILSYSASVTDVAQADIKYIDTAIKRGMITVPADGKFYPDAAADFDFAMRAMVAAAGYIYEVNKDIYMDRGMSIGLTKSLRSGAGSGLSAGDVCVMLYNLLNADYVEYDMNGEFAVSEYTVLEAVYGIRKIQAKLVANSISDMTGIYNPHKDGVVFHEYRTGAVYKLNAGRIETNSFLGRICNVYYNMDTDELIYMSLKYTDDMVLFIEAEKFQSFSLSDREIYYKAEVSGTRWESSEKTKSYEIPNDVDVLYNGQFTTEHQYVFGILENQNDINIGDIFLYDTDDDGDVDLISVNTYNDIRVSAVNVNEGTVLDAVSGRRFDFVPENEEDIIFELKNIANESVELSALKTDCIISVSEGLGTPRLVRAVVCDKTVSCTVNSVYEQDGMHFVSADTGTYRISNVMTANGLEVTAGETYKLLLNMYGVIASVKVDDSVYDTIGSVVSLSFVEDSETAVEILFYTANGEFVTYRTADKWYIDGNLVEAEADGRRYYVDSGVQINVTEKLRTAFLQFRINAKNELTRIIIPGQDATDGGLVYTLGMSYPDEVFEEPSKYVLRYKSNGKYFFPEKSGNSCMNFIVAGDKTKLIKIPSNKITGGREAYYSIEKSLKNDTTASAVGYTFTKGSPVADIVVMINDSAANVSDSKNYVVSDISKGLNADDECGYIIKCMDSTGSETQFVTAELFIPEYSLSQNKLTGNNADLEVGDVIQVATDSKGICNAVAIKYDCSKKTGHMKDENYWYAAKRFVMGSVYNVTERAIAYVVNKEITPSLKLQGNLHVMGVSSTRKVILVDTDAKKDERVKIGSVSDIIGYTEDKINYSHIVTQNGYGEVTLIICYN